MRTHHTHHSLPKGTAIALVGLSVAVFMTSCQTPGKAPAKPEASQQSLVAQAPLPSLLDYLAAHRQEWDYDKIAEICAIDHYDKKSSSEANWDNKDDSPFAAGALFYSPDLWRAGQPFVPSGCYLKISKKSTS